MKNDCLVCVSWHIISNTSPLTQGARQQDSGVVNSEYQPLNLSTSSISSPKCTAHYKAHPLRHHPFKSIEHRQDIGTTAHTLQTVVTPVFSIKSDDTYNTSITSTTFSRDPESLLLSIINLAASPLLQAPPTKSRTVPTLPADYHENHHEDALPSGGAITISDTRPSSVSCSPILEKMSYNSRPITALNMQHDANFPLTKREYDKNTVLPKYNPPRCTSAKVIAQYPDSLFSSELESSCATPQFLHLLPLITSSHQPSQEIQSQNGNTVETTSSLHVSHLQALPHIDSSVISAVNVLSTQSNYLIPTPTAPLSARLDSLTTLNTVRQYENGEEHGLALEITRSPLAVKSNDERRQYQLSKPAPLPALQRNFEKLGFYEYVDSSADSTRPDVVIVTSIPADSTSKEGCLVTNLAPCPRRDVPHGITHLRIPDHIYKADKLATPIQPEISPSEPLLNDCSKTSYEPSTWQIDQSMKNLEPEQLCLLAPKAHEYKPSETRDIFKYLTVTATPVAPLYPNELVASTEKSQVDLTTSSLTGSYCDQKQAQPATLTRATQDTTIKPIHSKDSIFDTAKFHISTLHEKDPPQSRVPSSFSKINTSMISHDSSMKYGLLSLTKSMSSCRTGIYEPSQRRRASTESSSITPICKKVEVNLIQLDRIFNVELDISPNKNAQRCKSSGSFNGSHRGINATSMFRTTLKSHRPSSVQANVLRRAHEPDILFHSIGVGAGMHMEHTPLRESEPNVGRQCRSTKASISGRNLDPERKMQKEEVTGTPKVFSYRLSTTHKKVEVMCSDKRTGEVSTAPHSFSQSTQRVMTSSRRRSAEEDYRAEIRQNMARMCASSTLVEKYRMLSKRQCLLGLQPLVRGTKIIDE